MAKQAQDKKGSLRRQRLSRAAREARMQRIVRIGTISVIGIVIALLIFAAIYTQVIQPRRIEKERNTVVATVGDMEITVGEMQDHTLYEYATFILRSQGQQQGLPPSVFAQFAVEELIRTRVVQAKADELGITPTEQDLQEQREIMLSEFLGVPFNVFQPVPTQDVTDTPTGPTSTPTLTPTYVYTLTPTVVPTIDPAAPPTLEPTATLAPTATPQATPTDVNAPTATPQPTLAPLTNEEYNNYLNQLFTIVADATGLEQETIETVWESKVYYSALQQRLIEELNIEADETKYRVNAAHILVDTEEEALAVLERLEAGEEFSVVAAEVSTDSTAIKGGDLGWFGPGQMVPEFEDAAFALEIGEVSEPVESQFGWHIIKLYDRVEEPTTDREKEGQREERFIELVEEWRSAYEVNIKQDVLEQNIPEVPGLSTEPSAPVSP